MSSRHAQFYPDIRQPEQPPAKQVSRTRFNYADAPGPQRKWPLAASIVTGALVVVGAVAGLVNQARNTDANFAQERSGPVALPCKDSFTGQDVSVLQIDEKRNPGSVARTISIYGCRPQPH